MSDLTEISWHLPAREEDDKSLVCEIKKKKCFFPDMSYCKFKDLRANSVDQNETAHNEPSHLDIRC